MKLIGLTGGIATGKSTVSSYLASQGIPVVDADLVARDVVRPGQPAHRAIVKAFGPTVLTPTGEIDRPKLGELVFADSAKRKQLNAATHPFIRAEMFMAVLRAFLRGEKACVLDAPLLFEAGLHKWVHSVIVVYCPDEVQKERLIRRDGLTDQQAQSRIDSQMPMERKRSLAHIVIDNSGTLEATRAAVDGALKKLVPGRLRTMVIWAVLALPAAFLYGIMVALKGWQAFRARVGGFGRITDSASKRPHYE
ncbi:hypothetical protein HK104_004436 [Borealophlyctis nickersoniae]|nr:hypothetical protein HK104_004436 [Borealophlyctis nickersoniae]